MSPERTRHFKRPLGKRRYRKLFVIAVEGAKTEPIYFSMFRNSQVIRVKCLAGTNNSSPSGVLKRMREYLRQEDLKKTDEAWLVVDKDHWTELQLRQLAKWSEEETQYHFALSNPKFEYWLLLHFEDGKGISSSDQCSEHLKKHLPNYDKCFDPRNITRQMINTAISRAKDRDNSTSGDCHLTVGCTTVYRLVEHILLDESV